MAFIEAKQLFVCGREKYRIKDNRVLVNPLMHDVPKWSDTL